MTLAAAAAVEVERRRTARDLSQRALARLAGMPPTLLHRSINGERDLTLDELDRLASALGVDVVWLIDSSRRRAPRSGDVRN